MDATAALTAQNAMMMAQATPKMPPKMGGSNATATMKTAKEFESVFISQFIGSMFEGVSANDLTGGGQGEEMFRSLMVDQYAKSVEQRGGFGLAAAVSREMLKHQEIPANAN